MSQPAAEVMMKLALIFIVLAVLLMIGAVLFLFSVALDVEHRQMSQRYLRCNR